MMEELNWTKVFSGKFLFTVITAGVFAYGVYSKILNGEQAYGIIMLVVAAYFGRQGGDNKPNGGGVHA